MQLIPLSESLKTKVDLAAVPGALSLQFLSSFDWAAAAAFIATVYGALRLIEYGIGAALRLVEWVKARRSARQASQVVDK